MAGKRRSITDVDKDIGDIKDSIATLAEAVGQLVDKANAEPEQPDKTSAQIAHEEEFAFYGKSEKDNVTYISSDKMMPEFEVSAPIGDWIKACAEYHERSISQELQLIIKKTYYASKASMEAELSKKQTLSGADK